MEIAFFYTNKLNNLLHSIDIQGNQMLMSHSSSPKDRDRDEWERK